MEEIQSIFVKRDPMGLLSDTSNVGIYDHISVNIASFLDICNGTLSEETLSIRIQLLLSAEMGGPTPSLAECICIAVQILEAPQKQSFLGERL
uniref:Uncharacterized protein n=1 Tax=Pithovirus LCPAC304 TaxID=2506594 RepID=A0A481Z926_9VIRU|nr:MAG: hypothetical protein LCPAC304_02230 [Pithovirus LCPAC304]